MNFFEILDRLKSKESALVIYCLLDRIPIIVFGDNSNEVNDFIIELSELTHFRKEIVFYTDFISEFEYESLMQIEDNDYNSQRIHVRCPCEVSLKALNHFDNFNSWIIGMIIPKRIEELQLLKNLIKIKIQGLLIIKIVDNKVLISLEGVDIKSIDLTFEENILKKIFKDTDDSIIRMRRVLTDKIKSKKVNNDFMDTLLDFSVEKNELKKNIFNKELHNFYSASKRAFFILSRLKLLNNLKISAKIGSRTLLKTIDYEQVYVEGIVSAPLNRIVTFIHKEWRENFSDLIQDSKKVDFEEKIQSLWV
ncbi:MAG: hypothetical protein ACFFBP_20055 [Promethearchaeota archaeon]